MSRRMTVRTVLAVVAAGLALAACGGDDTEPTTTDAPPAESSDAPPADSSDGSVGAAECAELSDVLEEVSGQFEGGVGLAVGEVPGDEQIDATNQLVDGIGGVEVSDPELEPLQAAMVDAAQGVLDRGEAGEELTQEDEEAFTSALVATGTYCDPLMEE